MNTITIHTERFSILELLNDALLPGATTLSDSITAQTWLALLANDDIPETLRKHLDDALVDSDTYITVQGGEIECSVVIHWDDYRAYLN